MTADEIEQEFNKIGIYEVDNTEIEYSKNPTHIKVIFSIDFKEEFVNTHNMILENFLCKNCMFTLDDIAQLSQQKLCVYSYLYADGKIFPQFIIEDYKDELIYKFMKVGLEQYLNKIFY